MAATHYQIFYRYVSPETNVPITNDLVNDYKETLEIVHQKHKLYNGTTTEQLEAEQEINTMLINETSPATCSKYDMIFAFNGAKKFYHKNWNAKTSSWTSEITSLPDGNVTVKEYGGDQMVHEQKVDGHYQINKYTGLTLPAADKAYIGVGDEATPAGNTLANFEKLRRQAVITAREDAGEQVDMIRERTVSMVNDCAYPYVIKDTYIRVPMSPWIKGSHCGSLESAIEKCKTLVAAIGMENIKLIKVVDIRQKIKIN